MQADQNDGGKKKKSTTLNQLTTFPSRFWWTLPNVRMFYFPSTLLIFTSCSFFEHEIEKEKKGEEEKKKEKIMHTFKSFHRVLTKKKTGVVLFYYLVFSTRCNPLFLITCHLGFITSAQSQAAFFFLFFFAS